MFRGPDTAAVAVGDSVLSTLAFSECFAECEKSMCMFWRSGMSCGRG